jgi:Transglutaminase-like superfamily
MKRLVLEGYCLLIRIEAIMLFRGLDALHGLVRSSAARTRKRNRVSCADDLCRAVDLACAFYPKRVMCLQRSAATTLLLRRHGVEAEMVIGAQMLPFKSHAWVELDGKVINDKPYMLELYRPLERC